MIGTTQPEYRAIFISDLHLGTRSCRADAILDFLRDYDADTIYLVGDVVDFWRLRHAPFWPQQHNDVIQKLLRKVRKGSRLVFIPGNHDEALGGYCGAQFGGIEVMSETVHETADGRRLLILHGDAFDGMVNCGRWLSVLGDRSYKLALWSNRLVNRARHLAGFGEWSLAAFLKQHVKQAVKFIERFEHAVSAEAQRRGFDGVVCGHVHHAADKTVNGIAYLNCGDWVESCTALVEDRQGRVHLVRRRDRQPAASSLATAETELAAA
ncbi:MAG: UDP-2,3-diacylglucosamine diphosphatase [Hyphomicrobiaceae bacterium]